MCVVHCGTVWCTSVCVAMCYSVLQCVGACCSVLQCVAVCCSVEKLSARLINYLYCESQLDLELDKED